MKKLGTIRTVVILLGAILLAACGQTAYANPSAPTDNAAVSAPTAAPTAALLAATNSSATEAAPTAAPLATSAPKLSSTSSAPVAAGNCTVLTKDDVSKVLAEAVEEVRDPSKDHVLCVYQTKNLILEVGFIYKFGGWVNSVNYMQNVRSGLGDLALVVPGLGDESFYNQNTKYIILLVRKGASVYSFGVRGVTAGEYLSLKDSQAKEKPLAELLLSRVP